MAKKKKAFKVSETFGDQKGQKTFTSPVKTSNAESIIRDLTDQIAQGKCDDFAKLLRQEFVYPKCLGSEGTNNDMSHGDWHQETQEFYEVRPTVEALFFDHNDSFHTLIQQLKNSAKSEEFYYALTASLKDTDLSKSTLFQWNEKIQTKVLKKLENLKNYSIKLLEKGALSKGEKAKTLADTMKLEIEALNKVEEKQNHKKNLQVLDIKLQLVRKLHAYDNDFSLHRGYARVVNVATVLFTAGIANGIRRAVKGSFIFFEKTATQEHVGKVQKSLGFKSQETIRFQP